MTRCTINCDNNYVDVYALLLYGCESQTTLEGLPSECDGGVVCTRPCAHTDYNLK